MKFYKLGEIPIQADDRVFRASRINAGVAFFVFLAITIAILLLGFFQVDGITAPRLVFFMMAPFSGLFTLLAFHSFRASLRPTNWLLRCNQRGVIIHYRSYLNWRFPNDTPQAVGFDYSEIAWVKTVKERRISPSLGGGSRVQAQQLTFLDVCLVNPDSAALEQSLDAERGVSRQGMMVSLDYPVQLLPDGILELRWTGIRPSAAKAIQYLSQHIKIAEADSRKSDLTHQAKLPPGEEDGKILELIKSGDELGAVTLTRQIYGCSLTEAREFVGKLRSDAKSSLNS